MPVQGWLLVVSGLAWTRELLACVGFGFKFVTRSWAILYPTRIIMITDRVAPAREKDSEEIIRVVSANRTNRNDVTNRGLSTQPDGVMTP